MNIKYSRRIVFGFCLLMDLSYRKLRRFPENLTSNVLKGCVWKDNTYFMIIGLLNAHVHFSFINSGIKLCRLTILGSFFEYTPEIYTVNASITRLVAKTEDDPRRPELFVAIRGLVCMC